MDSSKDTDSTPPPQRVIPFLFHFVWMQKFAFLSITLLAVLRSWGQGYFPYYLKKIIDFISISVPETIDGHKLLLLFLVLMGCWVTIELSMRLLSWLLMKATPQMRANIRNQTFSYLLGHSIDYFEQNLSGALAGKLSELPKHCEKILEFLLISILNTFLLTLFYALTFYKIGFVYCILVIALFASHALITVLGYKKIRLLNKLHGCFTGFVNGQFVDCLQHIRMIQSSNSQESELRRMGKYLKIEAGRYEKALGAFEATNTVRSCISILFTALSFGFLIRSWFHHEISLGDFSLICLASFTLTNNLWIMSHHLIKLFMEAAGAEDCLQTLFVKKNSQITALPLLKVSQGSISIKHLSFSYAKAQPLFSDLSLDIPPGQKVGIVGQSGSGKSTLMQLLLNFYKPQKGSIYIDGQDLSHCSTESLRKQINYIGQHFGLLHRSIVANLSHGAESISWPDLKRMAQFTQSDIWITRLHKGYLSLIGKECGYPSGGQVQSLLITRALLNHAPIIVIDEPTSALDTVLKKKLIDQLVKFAEGKTLLIATHHLSSLLEMDRIVVFKDGCIIEDGTPEELLLKQNHFFKLFAAKSV